MARDSLTVVEELVVAGEAAVKAATSRRRREGVMAATWHLPAGVTDNTIYR